MSLSNTTNLQVLLPDEQINKHAFIAAGVLLAVIGFFGFFLNLLVIVVILKDANNMWIPVNVVLLNLVVGLKKIPFRSWRIDVFFHCLRTFCYLVTRESKLCGMSTTVVQFLRKSVLLPLSLFFDLWFYTNYLNLTFKQMISRLLKLWTVIDYILQN